LLKLLRDQEEEERDVYIRIMYIGHSYKSASVILITVLAIILPLLAYLQYTWLGQISEQEYERMKNNLRTSAFHCSMDFSREMTSLIRPLGGELSGSDDIIRKTLQERILNWQKTSTNPALVSTEIKIIPLPFSDQTIRISANRGRDLFIFKDFSAIAITIKNHPDQVAVISLDLAYISSSIIPKIIQTNFTQDTWKEYDIMIANDGRSFIYRSIIQDINNVFKKSDIVVPFLMFRPSQLSPSAPDRPDPNHFRIDAEHRPEPFERRPPEFEQRERFSPQGQIIPPEERERIYEQGLFKMYLKHRENSLEEAVNNNRLRNIGISFGILILLGASIVFLLLSTNSARQLAQQQLEFVAGISHELRTPLSVLKSAGENLADGIIQGEVRSRQYGQLIKSEVARLSEMLEKTLAYAGIQSGNNIYEKKPFDISLVILEAIQNAKKIVSAEDVTVETVIDKHLPQVFGDAAAIRSALENLIVNGIKYSNEKKWIGIKVHPIQTFNTSSIEININDQGIGIAHNDLNNIFKPFYRGNNAKERQIQGNGLGLSITKHIIESHGGTISVKSSYNLGSVFTIRLPFTNQENLL
jgi:signal transduction histidine kinase